MTPEELYALVNRFIPPIAVALLASLAFVSCLAHMWLRQRPRVIALAVGCANIAAVYLWTHLAGLSVTARAAGVRLAIITMLVSILIYNESAWPWLSSFIRHGAQGVWSRIRWKR